MYERKIEIESRPPENLHEDSRLEATPAQQNNQQNQQNQNVNQINEMSSGENLRKYNILLQSMMLDIENPHMVQNSFLNENTVLNPKSSNNQNCVVQGLPF